jgi:tetratricopeptide (TPR) repeat protein
MEEVAFGPFSVDLSSNRLLRDGKEVKLRRQAFRALRVLALHAGRYVEYDQLLAEAWDGTIVSRHTIDVTIGEVRRTLADYGSWIRHRSKGGYCLDVPKSDGLIRLGWHFWNLRTREGFERALECFQQAGEEAPRDHRAFEGQCSCYLLLASMGMLPGRDMYRGFLEAHRRAVTIVGLTPELRCDRAHGLHMYERRLDEAEAELEQVIREKPSLAAAYVRLAMVQVTRGRLDEALDAASRAYAADPLWPLVAVTEVTIRFWRREFELAAALGAKAVELHPYFILGRAFYAQALEFSGRLDDALAQYQHAAVISPGMLWLQALEGVCLVKLGREDEARALLAQLAEVRQATYIAPYAMALLRRALGQVDEAFVELERAIDDEIGGLYSLYVDPKADVFRADPRFAALLRKYYKGTIPPPARGASGSARVPMSALLLCQACAQFWRFAF